MRLISRILMVLTLLSLPFITYANTFTIKFFRGDVQIKESATASWKKARLKDSISDKGWILTGKTGGVTLKLPNKSTVRIGNNTIIQMKTLKNNKTRLKLQQGSLLAKVNKLTPKRKKI